MGHMSQMTIERVKRITLSSPGVPLRAASLEGFGLGWIIGRGPLLLSPQQPKTFVL